MLRMLRTSWIGYRRAYLMKWVAPVLFLCSFLVAILLKENISLALIISSAESIVKFGTPLALLAIGASFVLATRGVDISIAGIATLSGILFAISTHLNIPFKLSLFIGILPGIISGAFLGLLITKFSAPSLIVSWAFGVLGLLSSSTLAYVCAQTNWIAIGNGQSIALKTPVDPYEVWSINGSYFLASLTIISIFILFFNNTHLPKKMCSIGANRASSIYLGLNVKRLNISAYVISGICSSIAGIFLTLSGGSASTIDNIGYELIAIAVAVLGGTSMSGGYLTLWSVLCAAMFWANMRLIIPSLNISIISNTMLQQRAIEALFASVLIIVSLIFGRMLSGEHETILTERKTTD